MSEFRFYEKKFPNLIDKNGYIFVNKFLQLKNHKNIFVAGDVANLKEEKTAQSANEHSSIIIENIRNMENGEKLRKYHFKTKGILVSLGKYRGILIKENFVFAGIVPRLLKRYLEIRQMSSLKRRPRNI